MSLETPGESIEATQGEPAADPRLAATVEAGRVPQEEQAFARGALVGRYVILERLGAGAMGVVYGAYDPDLDRKVALKFLKSGAGDLEARARLLREAQAMARLAHPNVVTVHDVGTFRDEVFVAMEFVQGVTLRQWLRERERGWREVVAVFAAAGRGLAAAHEAGLVHRDLKPENIMIGADERVRVMDFGLARASGSDGGEGQPRGSSARERLALELTRTGSLVGTPPYMAPEQWEGHETDARSDQFSFCVSLWEAVFGERPFRGTTVSTLMMAITGGNLTPPSHPGRAPGWLRRSIERGLRVDPRLRWPSMSALLSELGRDRAATLQRWTAVIVGGLFIIAGGVGVQQVLTHRASVAAERERAERAETEAAAAQAQAEREGFERRVLEAAERNAEVLRLATTPARERDALVLGVKVLAPFGPDFSDAPQAATSGLARALPAMLPLTTLTIPDRYTGAITLSADGSLLVVDVARADDSRLWSTNVLPDPQGIAIWSTSPLELRGFIPRVGYERPVISPDNQLVAMSDRESCHVYGISTGERRHVLPECGEPRFSSDGRVLFGKVPARPVGTTGQMAMPYHALSAWDLASGALLWRTKISTTGHQASGPIAWTWDNFAFEVHPDGRRLVVAADDAAPWLLDATSGRRLASPWPNPRGWRGRDLPRHEETLALSPDGRYAAVANGTSQSGRVVVDLATMAIQSFPDAAQLVSFTRDGELLALGWTEGIGVYERAHASSPWARSGSAADAWPIETAEGAVLVEPDSTRLALLGAAHLVQSMDAPVSSLGTGITATPTSSLFAISSAGSVTVWDAADPLEEERWTAPPGELIVAFDDRDAVTRELATDRLRVSGRADRSPVVTLSDPGGSAWRVEGGIWHKGDDGFCFHDATSGEIIYRHVDTDVGGWQTADAARGAAIIAGATTDGSVDIVDAPSGRRICSIPGTGSQIQEVRISEKGDTVAILRGLELEVWSTWRCESYRVFHPLDGLDAMRGMVLGSGYLRFLGGDVLALGTDDRTVAYDLMRDAEIFRAAGRCGLRSSGPSLVIECYNEGRGVTVEVWDAEEGMVVTEIRSKEFRGWYSRKMSVAGSGEFVVAFTGDRQLAIIDLPSGEESFRLHTRTRVEEIKIREDDLAVDVLDQSSRVIHTYPATRAGLVAAACRALARTEVAGDVAEECARLERR